MTESAWIDCPRCAETVAIFPNGLHPDALAENARMACSAGHEFRVDVLQGQVWATWTLDRADGVEGQP